MTRNEKMKLYRAKSQAKNYVRNIMELDDVEWLQELIAARVEELKGNGEIEDEE